MCILDIQFFNLDMFLDRIDFLFNRFSNQNKLSIYLVILLRKFQLLILLFILFKYFRKLFLLLNNLT